MDVSFSNDLLAPLSSMVPSNGEMLLVPPPGMLSSPLLDTVLNGSSSRTQSVGPLYSPAMTPISSHRLSTDPFLSTDDNILANATHDMLVKANMPYVRLYNAYQQTHQTNQILFTHVSDVRTQIASLADTVKAFTGSIQDIAAQAMHTPTGSSSATLLPPFDQEKYPSAKFWYQREWKQYKKAKRHAGGISNPGEDADEKSKLIKELAFGYLTDKNGERVSLEAIDAVRDCCRQTYTSFDTAYNPHAPVEHRAELPPKKWKKEATLNQRTTLRRELESRFEFMRFCADGWKSERLAIDTLPGFRQKHPAPRPLPDEQFTRPGAGDSDNSDSSDDEPVRTSRTRKHADDGRNSGSKRRRETVIQQRPTNVNEAAEPLSHRQDLTETSSRQIRLLANPLHTLFDGDNGPRPDREPTPTPTARPAEPEDSTAASDRPRDPDAEPPLQEESTDDAPGRQLATAGGGENVDRLSPPIIQTSSSRENGDGQTSGSMAKKGKGPKPLKFDENSPVTARTLCGIDWCEANPGGSAVQFKTYWDGLPKDDKKDYDKKARALKAAGKGPLDTVN